jgi:hypothetical protein
MSVGRQCRSCYVETSVIKYCSKRVLLQNIHLKTACRLDLCIEFWVSLYILVVEVFLRQTIPQLPVGSGCVCCECDKVQQPCRCLSCLSTRRLSSFDARSTNCTSQFIFMTAVSCSKPRSSQHNLTTRPGKDLHRRICHQIINYCQINSIPF